MSLIHLCYSVSSYYISMTLTCRSALNSLRLCPPTNDAAAVAPPSSTEV